MEEDICENNHNIENIVISGGGPAGRLLFMVRLKNCVKRILLIPIKLKIFMLLPPVL